MDIMAKNICAALSFLVLLFSSAGAVSSDEASTTDLAQTDTEAVHDTPGMYETWRKNRYLLHDMTFTEVYPKNFYETDEFTYAVIGGSVVAAAAITYFTAGAGAPAVVPGTSALIVAAGGGGQGAYMAGLSTIGSVIGSNAIGGASIINGLGATIGLSASTSKSVTFGIALKTMFGVAAAGYDGVLVAESKKTGNLTYITEIRVPVQTVGSKRVRDLSAALEQREKEVVEAADSQDMHKAKRFTAYHKAILEEGDGLLRDYLSSDGEKDALGLNRDDLITLGVMAHKLGNFELFHKAIDRAMRDYSDFDGSESYLDYLRACSLLMREMYEEGAKALEDSIDAEPGVVETNLLFIVYLASSDFRGKEDQINARVRMLEQEFDEDDYDTGYTLSTVYFRLGSIYAKEGRHKKALIYFDKATENLNWMQKWPVMQEFLQQKFRNDIDLERANSYFLDGKTLKAASVIDEIMERIDDERTKQGYMDAYVGRTKH